MLTHLATHNPTENERPRSQPLEKSIRRIPKTFERESKYTHELVWRDGPYAIYRYHYHGGKPKADPKWKYEAVILRISPPHPKSQSRRFLERLPSNNDWGRWGWSLNTLEAAQDQIESVRETRGKKIESNYQSGLVQASIFYVQGKDLGRDSTLPTGKEIEASPEQQFSGGVLT